jgi:hypothetical protein
VFVLRPSSPVKLVQRSPQTLAPLTEAPAPENQEPFIDSGLPLPDSYDLDIVRAMLQDPFRILIYWEVREQSLLALTPYFALPDAQTFRTVLKLLDTATQQEVLFDVARRGRYWMTVFPDREYMFEIGVHSPRHGYISLVRSNAVRTPRGTVSPERAHDREYQLNPSEFLEVLDATGFGAQQTLGVTLSAVSEGAEEESWSAALLKLPEEVRRVLAIVSAGGELTLELIADLPEPLRSELIKLFLGGDGRIAAVGFMHYLPELLHEAGRNPEEWIGDHIRPLHVTQRFMLGGTENVALPGGELRWPALSRRPSSS